MPPPRIARPPRPCHPRRSTLQARWASNAARDRLSAHRDDPRPTRTADENSNAYPTKPPVSGQPSGPAVGQEVDPHGKAENGTRWGSWSSSVSKLLFGRSEAESRETLAEPIVPHVPRSDTPQSPQAVAQATPEPPSQTSSQLPSVDPNDSAKKPETKRRPGEERKRHEGGDSLASHNMQILQAPKGDEAMGAHVGQDFNDSDQWSTHTLPESSPTVQSRAHSQGTLDSNVALHQQLQQLVEELRRLNQRLDARESSQPPEAEKMPQSVKGADLTKKDEAVRERYQAEARQQEFEVQGSNSARVRRQEMRGTSIVVGKEQQPIMTAKDEVSLNVVRPRRRGEASDKAQRIRKVRALSTEQEDLDHATDRSIPPLRRLKNHLFVFRKRILTTELVLSDVKVGLRNSPQFALIEKSSGNMTVNSDQLRGLIAHKVIRSMGRKDKSASQSGKTVDMRSAKGRDTAKPDQPTSWDSPATSEPKKIVPEISHKLHARAMSSVMNKHEDNASLLIASSPRVPKHMAKGALRLIGASAPQTKESGSFKDVSQIRLVKSKRPGPDIVNSTGPTKDVANAQLNQSDDSGVFKGGLRVGPVKARDSGFIVAKSPKTSEDAAGVNRPQVKQRDESRMFEDGDRKQRAERKHGNPIVAKLSESSKDTVGKTPPSQARVLKPSDSPGGETQRLIRSLHTKATVVDTRETEHERGLDASEISAKEPVTSAAEDLSESSSEYSEQTLLEELFPEASSYIQPHYTPRNPYPKLDLPNDIPLVRPTHGDTPKSQRQQMLEAFQSRMEPITALQLLHCSTQLTEMDFRRLVPKGKHIESWVRDGEFTKVIPGRDPLSLERLPFYYLLFKSAEAALAYQNNATRLHKLAGLHRPTSIFSAIPPPKGFLEDGEDLSTVLSSYLLQPTSLKLNLNMVMQPYNPTFRALLEAGGYKPIVPSTGSNGEKIWKVLLHIEGWEPNPLDLYYIFLRHAQDRGLAWPFHDGANSVRKLRDLADFKSRLLATAAPRAANPSKYEARSNSDSQLDSDLNFGFLNSNDAANEQDEGKPAVSQLVMNRLYNRWIVEFSEEGAAQRFARLWNRRVLPAPRFVTWRDTEEVRMVNAEFLW